MKDIRAALVQNTFWYGVVTVLGLASGLLMSIVLARGLGPALMGDYSYLLWVLRTLTAFAALGWGVATARYTADAYGRGDRDRATGYVRFFMRRQLLSTLLVGIAVTPLIWLFVDLPLRWPFLVVVVMLLPVTVESIYTNAVYGAQRYDLTSQTSTVKMVLHLLAAVIAVAAGLDILGLVIGLTLGSTVSCLLQRHHARAVLGASPAEPTPAARAEARAYVLPLSVVIVLDALVWDRSEVFFLRLYTSSEEIAFYSLAFGLATRVMVIPEIGIGALLPAFAALHGRGAPDELARVYRTALRYVALVGVPIAALVAALAPGLVAWLYGPSYRPVAGLLGILVLVGLVSTLRKVVWAALRAVGDRRQALWATGVSAVVDVVLAATLIPAHATAGALVANAAAQVVATVWAFTGMARVHRAHVPLGDLARTALAGGAAFLAARLVAGSSNEALWLVAAAAAGSAVFLGACILGRLVGPREWTLLTTSTRRLLAARATTA